MKVKELVNKISSHTHIVVGEGNYLKNHRELSTMDRESREYIEANKTIVSIYVVDNKVVIYYK